MSHSIVERTPGETEIDAPLFDLNYGLPDIQLKLETPIKVVHENPSQSPMRSAARRVKI
jgi:hypothetical protein